jgi:hypothetical protein
MSAHSLAEIFALQAENRAWNKELRSQAASLVNNRLAKNITLEDYAASRQRAVQEAAECSRRANVLLSEIESRAARPLPQFNLLKQT